MISKRLFMIGILLVALLVGMTTPAYAQEEITLTFTCRCVAGGVNANLVTWLTTYVIPTFEEEMAAQGKNVTVNLVEFGGSDEELKQQYALDLSVGAGYDVFAFDGSGCRSLRKPDISCR